MDLINSNQLNNILNNNKYVAIVTSYDNDKIFQKLKDPINDVRYIINKKNNLDLGFDIKFISNPNENDLKYILNLNEYEKKLVFMFLKKLNSFYPLWLIKNKIIFLRIFFYFFCYNRFIKIRIYK